MASNIEIRVIGGQQYESYVGTEPAWHGLGTIYDKPLSAAEALKGCHADFEVSLQPLVAVTPRLENVMNGAIENTDDIKLLDNKRYVSVDMLKEMLVDSHRATMRTDLNEVLGIVTKSYGVVQNSHAFDFIDLLTTGKIGGEIPTIESAGVLGKGERIFICAKFPEPIRLNGNPNDIVNNYIIFTTSHNGMGAVTAMVSPIRVVCQNTLNAALAHNSGKITFKHTAHVMNRLDLTNKNNAEMAYRALNLYETYKKHFEESFAELAKIKVSDKMAEKIIAKAIFSPDTWKAYEKNNYSLNCDEIGKRSLNAMDAIKDSIESGIGQNIGEKGTALHLINGITTHYQNSVDWKDNEKKFNAIIDGSVQNKLQSVFDSVWAMRTAA